MDISNIPLLKMLATRMNYASERQAVLSQNLANIDTPNYTPRDLEPLTFKDMLAGASRRLNMSVSSPKHIGTPGAAYTQYDVVSQTNTFETKPIGNSVSLEEQSMLMAHNQGDFTLSNNVYKKMLDMFRLALGPRS
jgi:flagellar basal-body rod protein FlgB